MLIKVKLKNMLLEDTEEYVVNDYVKLVNDRDKNCIKLYYEDNKSFESNAPILSHAIDLAMPSVMVRAYCDDDVHNFFWKTRIMFSYYGETEYKNEEIINIPITNVKEINEWIKRLKNNNEVHNGLFSSWNVAYNEYLDAVSCGILEKAYMHLITALEALIITGNSELTYRVSLHTAMLCGKTKEDRISIFDKIKKAYSLRSATVHGDINAMKKNFKDQNLYELMFSLREIISEILRTTYGMKKENIIAEINNKIFS